MYVRAFAALVVCDALVAPAVTTRRASSLRAYKTPDLVSVFARLAESANVLSSGLGVSLPGQLWTAIFVLCSSAAVTEPSFRAACEARAHYLMAGYMLTNHLVRVVLLDALRGARAREG